jgi:hypothetical protein
VPNVIVDISSLNVSVNVTEASRNVGINISQTERIIICNFEREHIVYKVGVNNTNKRFYVRSGSQPIIYEDLNELSKYQLENFDLTGDPIYAGYMDKGANWYIAKIDTALGDKLYAAGSSDYAINWDDKENLNYATYAETF